MNGWEGRERPRLPGREVCPVSPAWIIAQVEVKNRVQPQIRRGIPIVNRAWLVHAGGKSQK